MNVTTIQVKPRQHTITCIHWHNDGNNKLTYGTLESPLVLKPLYVEAWKL